jgi:hypothetical protein
MPEIEFVASLYYIGRGKVMATHITDEQLIAYLDGEVEPEVAAQIEASAVYRERVEALAALQNRLLDQLSGLQRPSTLDMSAYHLGFLSETQARDVAAYLAKHPHEAHGLELLDAFLADLEPAPQTAESSPFEPVKRLIAQLVSGTMQTAVALRGQTEGVYQAENVQIAIEVDVDEIHPAHKVLSGLITGIETGNWQAILWLTGSPPAGATISAIDESGNFTITDLVPGIYELVLSGGIPPTEIFLSTIQV